MRFVARDKGLPIGAIVAGAGLLAGSAIRLLHLDHLPIPLCMFRALTGVPCMGCGSTRALGRLAHLDLRGALAFHPLITSLALGMALWALVDLVLLTRGRVLRLETTPREARLLLVVLVVLALVNWVYLIKYLH